MTVRSTRRAFIDAGYVTALLLASDPYNAAASRWSAVVQREGWHLVTTTAVLAEIGNAFAKQWFRVSDYLRTAVADPAIEVVPVTTDLILQAVELRDRRLDKDWGSPTASASS